MAKKYNIILILLDGSRIDMIDRIPGLSSMQDEGTFFDNCIVSSPYTIASVHSLLTGMYGLRNGVNSYYNMFGLKKNVKTLTEYLKEANYSTYGDVLGEAVISKRGFDELTIHDEYKVNILEHHKKIIERASRNNNFFTFLQYSQIHTASVVNSAKKFDSMDGDFYTDAQKKINEKEYLESLENAGNYRSEIMRHIEKLGIKSDAIVIFFSDHGSSIGEKFGENMYGSFTYDYTIRSYVNFVNSKVFPNKLVNTQIRMIDIMPTILEIVGIRQDEEMLEMEGESLMNLLSKSFFSFLNKNKDRLAYVSTGGLNGPWPSPNLHNVKCIRTSEYKLIHNEFPDTWEFYNLKKDPSEEINLIGKDIKLENKFKEYLKESESNSLSK